MKPLNSNFRLIGVGQVVKDKAENNYKIELTLTELMPTLEGDYNATSKKNFNTTNIRGSNTNVSIDKYNTITATWIGIYNSNRITAPDVVIGEYVHVFQQGGNDEYFWASVGMNLRKKEKVIYAYANKEVSAPNSDTGEKQYYFMVDTRNKEIILHTDDSDNEKSLYDFVLNTGDGIWSIKDKQGNYFHLESTLQNGTYSIKINNLIQVKTKHTVIETDDTYTLETKKFVQTAHDTITTTTKTEKKNNDKYISNTSGDYNINTGKLLVNVGSDELLQLLQDFCTSVQNATWIGNLGIPAPITGAARSDIEGIKQRFKAMMAGDDRDKGLEGTKWEEKDTIIPF